MILIPCSTDAPVYHWPWATGGVIAANLFFFVGYAAGIIPEDLLRDLSLRHGDGIHPAEWMTSLFIHTSIFRFVSNTAFIWIFGLILEGKLGWWKFLGSYLAIGMGENAIEQALSLLFDRTSITYGASAAVYGLMAMTLVWAPTYSVRFIWYFVLFWLPAFEWSVRALAAFFFGLDVLLMLIFLLIGGKEAALTAPLFHFIGAGLGISLAILFLEAEAVDCDGLDILSLRRARRRKAPSGRGRTGVPAAAREPECDREADREEARATAARLFEEYLREGDPLMAATVYEEGIAETGAWSIPGPLLDSLISGLRDAGALARAKPYLEMAIGRTPSSVPMKLLLARVLIEEERRPASGLEVLESIIESDSSGTERGERDELASKARDMIAAGVLEFDVDPEDPSQVAPGT
jgi:membrane associated rhomboid family serine protease